MPSKSNITHILLLAVLFLVIIITLPGLSGPLVFDDLQNLAPLLSVKTKDYVSIIFGNNSGLLGRSVSMASFVINHWISGKLIPYELKLTNLIIHLSNGALLYFLAIILLKRFYPKQHNSLALAITALWLLNPINISTSLYIVQRMALLSCFFVLLGCLAYTLTRTKALRPTPLGYGIVLACWLLASLSKENGIILPVFIFLIEVCCFDYLLPKIKSSSSLKFSIPVLALIIGLVGFAAVEHAGLLDYSSREFTLSERLITQPPVVMDYIRQTLLPSHANTGLYNDDYIVNETFWNPETGIGTGILVLAIILSLTALFTGKLQIPAFGLLFFIAGHSLESTIFPLEIYFSHRNYLPSVGLCITTIVGVWLLARSRISFRVGTVLVASYFSFLTFQSWQTAQAWSSRTSMIVNGFLQHPGSVRANLDMTQLLADQGNFQQSLQVNAQILKLRPDAALRSYIQRFYVYCILGENVPTREYDAFPVFIKFGHYLELSTALDNLLHSYQKRQCSFVDIRRIALMLADEVDRTIVKYPYYVHQLWSVEYYIINFMFSVGDKEAAIARLRRSVLLGNEKAQLYLESLNLGAAPSVSATTTN